MKYFYFSNSKKEPFWKKENGSGAAKELFFLSWRMLFQEGKLTFGKAIQLSGLTRFEFEKALSKENIPISNPSIDQVFSDMKKLSNF